MDRARRILAENLDLYEDLLAGGGHRDPTGGRKQRCRKARSTGARMFEAALPPMKNSATPRATCKPGISQKSCCWNDGGMFALELVEGLPATPRPLDDIRTQVVQDWQSDEIRARLSTLAEALMEEVEGGNRDRRSGP